MLADAEDVDVFALQQEPVFESVLHLTVPVASVTLITGVADSVVVEEAAVFFFFFFLPKALTSFFFFFFLIVVVLLL